MNNRDELFVCGSFSWTAEEKAPIATDMLRPVSEGAMASSAGSGALLGVPASKDYDTKCVSFSGSGTKSESGRVVFGSDVDGAKVCKVGARGFECEPVRPGAQFAVGARIGAVSDHYRLSDREASFGVLAVDRGDKDFWTTRGQGHMTARHGSIQRVPEERAPFMPTASGGFGETSSK